MTYTPEWKRNLETNLNDPYQGIKGVASAMVGIFGPIALLACFTTFFASQANAQECQGGGNWCSPSPARVFTQRELNAINDACYEEVSAKFPVETVGHHFGECVKYVQTRWMEQKLQ